MGISVDSPATQKEFGAKNGVTFTLLSDYKRETARAYGILNDEGYANRSTFLIDKDGKIRAIELGNSAISSESALGAAKAIQ
jgi:peroxiredoxin